MHRACKKGADSSPDPEASNTTKSGARKAALFADFPEFLAGREALLPLSPLPVCGVQQERVTTTAPGKGNMPGLRGYYWQLARSSVIAASERVSKQALSLALKDFTSDSLPRCSRNADCEAVCLFLAPHELHRNRGCNAKAEQWQNIGFRYGHTTRMGRDGCQQCHQRHQECLLHLFAPRFRLSNNSARRQAIQTYSRSIPPGCNSRVFTKLASTSESVSA